MSYIESHDIPANMPSPSLHQQLARFVHHGGKIEDFTFPIDNADNGKGFAFAVAKQIGKSVTFLTQMLKKNPENEAQIMQVRAKIARTLSVSSGILPVIPMEEENLELNYIGNK